MSGADWVGSVAISLIAPLIGFALGMFYAFRGGEKSKLGLVCVAASIASMLFIYFVLMNGGEVQQTGI